VSQARLAAVIILVLAGRSASLSAQVDVRATVSSDTIGLDESVEYQVSVRGAGLSDVESPELSTPAGLTLFGRTQTSEVSIVNGSVERRTVFTLVFRPYRLGTTTIGPATVRVGSDRFHAPPLSVAVVEAGGGAAQRRPLTPPALAFPPPFADEEPPPEARRGGLPPIFVSNRLDRDTVYVGEQAVLTFAFYQSPRAMVLDQPNYSSAKTPGFWTQDFNREPEITRELLDGEPYTIQRFYYALFPLTPGEKTISPATLTLTLRDPTSFLDRGRTRTLTGDTLHLTVLPLPAEGRPPDFSGPVGRYRLEARVEPRELERDAPANVVITVSGDGNIATISPPRLPETRGLKAFEPEVRAHVDAGSLTVGGSKEFRYLVVPKQSGTIDLGTVSLSYFDPRAGAYRTASVDLGSLAVRRPAGGAELAEGSSGRPLAGIRTGPLDEEDGRPWLRPLFWALAALPPAALAILALGRRKARHRVRAAPAVRLEAAARLREDPTPEGVARAERNLIEHLERRHGVALSGLAVSERETALRRAGVSEPQAALAARAMRALDEVAFAPPWARSAAASRALAALVALEEAERPRRARASQPALPGLLMALVAALLTIPGLTLGDGAPLTLGGDLSIRIQDEGATGTAPAAWERANRLYLVDDLGGAEELYRRVLTARPNSVAARYNLGNALFRQGRIGAALQQYLAVLRRSPRDAAARANAQAARRALGVELAPEERDAIAGPAGAPASWLSPAETAWAALVTLYLLGVLAAVAIATPRRRAVATGAAAVIFLAAAVFGVLTAATRLSAPEALVTAHGVQARAGPAFAQPPVITLPEGAAVRAGEKRGEWVFVSLPNGLSGWVERRDVGVVP
jgi:tetratricopeptide (TPR) repeat protein